MEKNECVDGLKNLISQNLFMSLIPISNENFVYEERVQLNCFYCSRYNTKWTCPPKIPPINYKRIAPDFDRSEYIRLDMNENPIGLPDYIIEEFKECITGKNLAMYPNKTEMIEQLSILHDLNKNQFCLTDGSEMAIKYIFEVFAKPNSAVVTVFPSFEMYGVYCNMFGLKHKKISVQKDFSSPVNEIISAINDDVSIVVLLNPNNPVGDPYSREDVMKIIERAKKHEILIIIDEAYHYFYKNSFVDLINHYDNIIILRTFSKIFSLAGCRIGYAISNSEVIKYLDKVRPSFDTNSLISEYNNLLVLKYERKFQKEDFDVVRNESTNEIHRALLQMEKFLYTNNNSLAISFIGGSCKLCKNGCGKERCNNPGMARIPLEATGVNVIKTLANIGIKVQFPIKDRFYRYGLIAW